MAIRLSVMELGRFTSFFFIFHTLSLSEIAPARNLLVAESQTFVPATWRNFSRHHYNYRPHCTRASQTADPECRETRTVA